MSIWDANTEHRLRHSSPNSKDALAIWQSKYFAQILPMDARSGSNAHLYSIINPGLVIQLALSSKSQFNWRLIAVYFPLQYLRMLVSRYRRPASPEQKKGLVLTPQSANLNNYSIAETEVRHILLLYYSSSILSFLSVCRLCTFPLPPNKRMSSQTATNESSAFRWLLEICHWTPGHRLISQRALHHMTQ